MSDFDDMQYEVIEPAGYEMRQAAEFAVELSRRGFVKLLGAGLLFTITPSVAMARRFGGRGGGRGGGGRGGSSVNVAARLHINPDGVITVMTGKVEEGQGSRTQIIQAAAEELRVSADRINLVMADTQLVPDDGMTAGSRTTPSTIPAIRQGAAAARELLTNLAARKWSVQAGSLRVSDGVITNPADGSKISYAQLAQASGADEAFKQSVPAGVRLTERSKWKVLGTPVRKPNLRDLVTGAHQYPSDVSRPNMLYGKVLRQPSYGATLESVDLAPARAMKGVVVVRDGQFIGCAAPTTQQAAQAVDAIARTARWKTIPHPSSKQLHEYLRKNARYDGPGGGFDGLAKVLTETYTLEYIQHVPMETRAATAEWDGDKLTVWGTGDYPQRIQGNLAGALGIGRENVRFIVPDMGGGFGGKHSAEAAEEAARLARAAKSPVAVKWTRQEEFTWAYFRPAAVIECKGGLDSKGSLAAWDFTNINAGGSGVDSPYEIPGKRTRSVGTDSPLKQGPYRCLAATGNNFARESFMDELAAAAGVDPLEFRLKHLKNERIIAVLKTAAERFGWSKRVKNVTETLGVGLACGTEKGSVVAACAEVSIDRKQGKIKVNEVCEAFEPGPVQNPDNMTAQVQGCIVMGLGGALSEAMEFEDGRILNPDFFGYRVPRFADVPKIEVHFVENNSIDSVGGGETPIIAVAPAVGNAIFAATGVRLRSMPMKTELLKKA